MNQPVDQLRQSFARDGYVVVRNVLPRDEVLRARGHAEALIGGSDETSRRYVQTAFDAKGGVKMVKASGLAEHDSVFNELATRPALVDVVETLLGTGSRRFRDVMVVKPGTHRRRAFLSPGLSLLGRRAKGTGVGVDRARRRSHRRQLPQRDPRHTRPRSRSQIYLRNRYELPKPVTRTLRRLVSLAGTGDNPEGAGGSVAAWKAKRWLLAETTKYAPVLFDLQDFRVPPEAVKKSVRCSCRSRRAT